MKRWCKKWHREGVQSLRLTRQPIPTGKRAATDVSKVPLVAFSQQLCCFLAVTFPTEPS